jgi:hypothetical protein
MRTGTALPSMGSPPKRMAAQQIWKVILLGRCGSLNHTKSQNIAITTNPE